MKKIKKAMVLYAKKMFSFFGQCKNIHFCKYFSFIFEYNCQNWSYSDNQLHEALDLYDVKLLKYYLGICVSITNPNPKEVWLPMEKVGIVHIS
jgi:hypothetical protein